MPTSKEEGREGNGKGERRDGKGEGRKGRGGEGGKRKDDLHPTLFLGPGRLSQIDEKVPHIRHTKSKIS